MSLHDIIPNEWPQRKKSFAVSPIGLIQLARILNQGQKQGQYFPKSLGLASNFLDGASMHSQASPWVSIVIN